MEARRNYQTTTDAIWFRALRGRALTCRAARRYPRALTGLQIQKAPASTEAFWFCLQYDDVTGVLMQCISRIPLSYRRKAKTPQGRGFRHVQIVASHRCHRDAALPSMNELSKLLGENQC
ncbi:hypothetical protein KPSB59_4230027 [Klebsiella quasipneumoniae subsp. quasipneumoniae]|nr:hypothetical protein KPSB59_4230027 [Klebsiella quasipneumoniae subsp. quasipneumoniae]